MSTSGSSEQSRILVVDEAPEARAALVRQLAHLGHDVAEAATGAEALLQAAALRPQVILLDLELADPDGPTLLARLAEAGSRAAVVALGARGLLADVEAAGKAGAVDYLALPWTRFELVAAVAHARACHDDPAAPRRRPGSITDTLARIASGDSILPAVPAVLSRLRALLADPDSSVARVVAQVQLDQRLAAEVLRNASSAFQAGAAGPTTDLTVAVNRVGLRRVHVLAETAFLQGFTNVADARARALLQRLWQHSLARAEAMRMVSRALTPAAFNHAEACYLVGLFDDVGAALLLWLEGNGKTREGFAAREETCLSMIRAHHQELGALMLWQWQIAPVVAESVPVHHSVEPPARWQREWAIGVIATDMVERLAPGLDLTRREPFSPQLVESCMKFVRLSDAGRQELTLRLFKEHGKIAGLLR